MTTYFYTTIPGVIPAPFPGDANVAGPPVIFSARVLLEHALLATRIDADRADLVDSRRILRVEERFLERMQKDGFGYFINIGKTKFYFVAQDPITPADAFVREWSPL